MRMKWEELPFREKAEYIRTGVKNGLNGLEEIKNAYHSFAEGGPESTLFDKQKVYNRVLGDEIRGGNTGPISSIKQYFTNEDNAVETYINKYKSIYDSMKDKISLTDAIDKIHYLNRAKFKMNVEDYNNAEKEINKLNEYVLAPQLIAHEDAKDKYLGLPQRNNSVISSKYKPSNSSEDSKYYTFKQYSDPFFTRWIKNTGDALKKREVGEYGKLANLVNDDLAVAKNLPIIHAATISKGVDPSRGEYYSIYDKWDYNTNVFDTPGDNVGEWVGGKPFEIYDRVYLDDYYGVSSAPKEGDYYGGYLPEVLVTPKKQKVRSKKALGGNLYEEGGPPIRNFSLFDTGEGILNYGQELSEFKEGGEKHTNKISDKEYYKRAEEDAKINAPIWGVNEDTALTMILNDNGYDYRGWYNDPKSKTLNANGKSHWPDTYKTVYHPTFSDESIYSGIVDEKFNPLGLQGGHWEEDLYMPPSWKNLKSNVYDGTKEQSNQMNVVSDKTFNIPYSPQAVLEAAVKNPNGGIFIGDANIPHSKRELQAPMLDEVVVTHNQNTAQNYVNRVKGVLEREAINKFKIPTPDAQEEALNNFIEKGDFNYDYSKLPFFTPYNYTLDRYNSAFNFELFDKEPKSNSWEKSEEVKKREAEEAEETRIKQRDLYYKMLNMGYFPLYDDWDKKYVYRAPRQELYEEWRDLSSDKKERFALENNDSFIKQNLKKKFLIQCAEFANNFNQKIRRPTTGNAWTRQGIFGDTVLYDANKDKGISEQLKSQLQDGDFLDVRYMFTTHSREAATGRGNSHTANIILNSDGKPHVVHNMGGKVLVEPLNEFLDADAYEVTRIARPNLTPQRQWKKEHENDVQKNYNEDVATQDYSDYYNTD